MFGVFSGGRGTASQQVLQKATNLREFLAERLPAEAMHNVSGESLLFLLTLGVPVALRDDTLAPLLRRVRETKEHDPVLLESVLREAVRLAAERHPDYHETLTQYSLPDAMAACAPEDKRKLQLYIKYFVWQLGGVLANTTDSIN